YDEPCYARFERCIKSHLVLMHGQNNDFGWNLSALKQSRKLDSIGSRHVDVKDSNIGPQSFNQSQSGITAFGLSYNLHFDRGIDDHTQSAPEDWMIVG